jgi:topoisomerase IA-like protein
LAQKKKAPLIEKVVPPTRSSEDVSVDDWLNSILEKSAKKKAPVKPAEEKMAEPKPTAKRAPAKRAPAKKAVKKTTTGRAR